MVWSAHHHGHGNGNGGKWKDWILGITGGLTVAGIGGLLSWMIWAVAPQLGALAKALEGLDTRLAAVERHTQDIYTRTDAYHDSENVTRALGELDGRIVFLEQNRAIPDPPHAVPVERGDGWREHHERITPHR